LTTKVPIANSEGEIMSIIGFSHDVTEFIELKQKLERMAQTDELTQIANRRHFLEIAERDFKNARRYASPLCVMVFDVDFFKSINDTYGHHVGDTVLKEIAKTAAASIRESDFIGRIGGEEFAVVLPHTRLKSAANLAERLRKKIGKLTLLAEQKQSINITISIGVVEVDSADKKFEDTLIRTDRKLYQAKAEGRNRVCR
jgi:diguanylate cyclase (GGDEF)-like protein